MSKTLTWTNNETKAYALYADRCTDGFFSQNVVSFVLAQGATSFTDTSVSGTGYFYRVRAVNASGSHASATFPAVAPVPPSNLSVTGVPGNTVATWVNNDLGDYSLYIDRSTDSSFIANLVSTTLSQRQISYTDTKTASGTTYYYRVRAVNVTGTSVSPAVSITFFIPPPPAPTVGTLNGGGIFQLSVLLNQLLSANYYRLRDINQNIYSIRDVLNSGNNSLLGSLVFWDPDSKRITYVTRSVSFPIQEGVWVNNQYAGGPQLVTGFPYSGIAPGGSSQYLYELTSS